MGTFEHKLDSRERLSIPAKFRNELTSHTHSPILTYGFEPCLFLYTFERWEYFSGIIDALHTSREHARNLERFLFANAEEVPLDKQGRILIQNHFKEHAHLTEEIVIVGVRHRIEIWHKDEWKSQSHMLHETAKEIAEKNTEFSI
ncbi:division/cell wall cluster transcriptional repressor MraZ [Chlamydiota bacterium]